MCIINYIFEIAMKIAFNFLLNIETEPCKRNCME